MDKKIRGIILFLLGVFLIILLMNKQIFQGDNIPDINKILGTLLNVFMMIFGKLSYFAALSMLTFGLLDIVSGEIKLKFHKSKIISYILMFLSLSMLFISQSVTTKMPSLFVEATRKLLELGFNSNSGGFIGALISMPLYRYIHLKQLQIVLIIIVIISLVVLLKEFIVLGYELLISLFKYYGSDDYKKKIKILKAKKIAEREEYIYQKAKRKEDLKARVIESRKNKLGFEIAKKPKETIFQKADIYAGDELKKKEKEWLEIYNRKIEDDKEKIDIEKHLKTNDESQKNNMEDELEIKNIHEYEVKSNFEFEQVETTLHKKQVAEPPKEEVEEIPDEESYYDDISEEIEIGDASEINELQDYEYDDALKKSIDQIFVQKTMDSSKRAEIETYIKKNVVHLESVLKEFGIEAKVVDYRRGPTITRYELTIPRGIKVSKVTSLSDDIAMSLAAESIRIEAPIPGKSAIGIETPNQVKEPVHFSNIIRNKELEKGALNIILGKDIVGRDKIIDIAKMPHLLIAGQTGSGKSVAVNTLISTLITKKSEREVKFIMVDPKMVELMPYNGIPHLLVPVIIDPKLAAIALKWAVNEMENRYRTLMEKGVRNIEGYNSLKNIEKMPYIVIIIDELADLMMVAAGTVEESIARIAQKARAIGIHLVVATQRPSTDVITGMIKANLPSRISFALRSQIDSRTILDTPGAEKLLGQGDMLLLENGSSKLERIQGAYISDDEVIKLTSALKKSRKVVYREEILIETEDALNDESDPLFQEAINIIRDEGKASISLLQRKLKVGFNRASRIFEQLKENGIIDDNNQIQEINEI